MKKVLVVWGNWGPYHMARFNAFRETARAEGISVEGIELFSGSDIYGWKAADSVDGLHRLDFGTQEMAFRPWMLTTQLAPLVFRLKPDVVFVPSYWHWSLFLNAVSRWAGARIVMMNESHAGTERARGLKKWFKRRVVASFHAALVGGTPHRRFFASMGLAEDSIHLGYDAVDNDHFVRASDAARACASDHRRRLGLPEQYVLSLGRFVRKKNLDVLLRAFAGLCGRGARGQSLHLVFVGSGETEPILRDFCREFELPTLDHRPDEMQPDFDQKRPAVHFYGFRQIEENPVFYALATAFVLPSLYEEWGLVVNEAMACGLPVLVSSRLGCTEDLVTHGENGLVFEPEDVAALTSALEAVSLDGERRRRMGAASRRRIADWGCERFADGALCAVRSALGTR